MPWSLFRRSRDDRPRHVWWQQADTVADEPSPDGILALRGSMAAVDNSSDEVDDVDRRAEFLEGLQRLVDLRAMTSLPDIPTQHRVIASDRCHFIAPASLAGPTGVAGKLFLTSNRAIFVGASVVSWPWHRVRGIARQDRDLVLTIVGGADLFVLRCNCYGDALEARFIAEILASAASRGGGSRG
jgi:hypothetical protein